ncbi:hypothetical protein N9R79_07280 [Vibrio sp.]|nr:hypothetical protein [Vibrio sp.]
MLSPGSTIILIGLLDSKGSVVPSEVLIQALERAGLASSDSMLKKNVYDLKKALSSLDSSFVLDQFIMTVNHVGYMIEDYTLRPYGYIKLISCCLLMMGMLTYMNASEKRVLSNESEVSITVIGNKKAYNAGVSGLLSKTLTYFHKETFFTKEDNHNSNRVSIRFIKERNRRYRLEMTLTSKVDYKKMTIIDDNVQDTLIHSIVAINHFYDGGQLSLESLRRAFKDTIFISDNDRVNDDIVEYLGLTWLGEENGHILEKIVAVENNNYYVNSLVFERYLKNKYSNRSSMSINDAVSSLWFIDKVKQRGSDKKVKSTYTLIALAYLDLNKVNMAKEYIGLCNDTCDPILYNLVQGKVNEYYGNHQLAIDYYYKSINRLSNGNYKDYITSMIAKLGFQSTLVNEIEMK